MVDLFRKARKIRNPYLIFLPFLGAYIIIVIVSLTNNLVYDETRFISFARHLTEGYFATPDKTIGNGPGYSIILAPFLILKIPLVFVKILNAFFHYFSIVFLFKTVRGYVSFKLALVFGLFWACYYNTLVYLNLMHSEIFASFLATLFLYLFVKVFKSEDGKNKRKYVVLAGITFGFLVLSKVIFGYVLLVMIVGVGVLWLFNIREKNYKDSMLVLGIAFIVIAPYLFYTYNLTNRLFYWTTNSGENLYWMTTHYEGEYGTWLPFPTIVDDNSGNSMAINDSIPNFSNYSDMLPEEHLISGIADTIRIRHLKDFQEVYLNSRTGVERNDVLMKISINNIKANPSGYIKNCFNNIGRMLFNFPYSYSTQRPATLLRIPLNGIIVLLALFCLVPTFLNWRKLIFSIRFMLFFVLLYLGGSTLVSAEVRMFSIIVPLLLFWIAYVIEKSVKINLKF